MVDSQGLEVSVQLSLGQLVEMVSLGNHGNAFIGPVFNQPLDNGTGSRVDGQDRHELDHLLGLLIGTIRLEI